MRRDRKSKIRRERMVMLASSALVMGALTLTGIYAKNKSAENIDDGYTIDFSRLEESVDDKAQQIAENLPQKIEQDSMLDQVGELSEQLELAEKPVPEEELDYDPLAAGSHVIEIPGLTDQTTALTEKKELDAPKKSQGESVNKIADTQTITEEKMTSDTMVETVTKTLNFSAEQGMARPVNGEILMYYSMDKSIYFATLDQYKYNPATVISALEGDQVIVCADAKVISVYENEVIGRAVTLDLGNGYQATYGQLKDIQVTEGSYVNRGELLGSVAAPTKYYTLEGPNLYFQVTKDGVAVNAEGWF